MDSPHLASLHNRTLLASGTSGAVFRAEKSDGSVVALKLFDGMAVNRALLEKAHQRLSNGSWPAGVIECLDVDYRSRPAIQITRCYADQDDQGHWRPRTLQQQLDEFPGERSWEVIWGLMESVAALHDRQVAHGNLKPGNIFFDDDGKVLITDWALGNMPDVISQGFTDACLYQPPEQLRHPEGYLDEAGYRWDVFAVGVIAFRLLTGDFPRCHKTFSDVAPPPGENLREGITADLEKIAAALEAEPEISWPTPASNELESRYRDIIQRCLILDPRERPANAIDLYQQIESTNRELDEKAQRDALLVSRRRAKRYAWQIGIAASLVTAALIITVFLWQQAVTRHQREVTSRQQDVKTLNIKLENERSQRLQARQSEAIARDALATGKSTWLTRLEASHRLSDQLFAWLAEHTYPELPALDPAKTRIPQLEQAYQKWLKETENLPELAEERARAQLHLSELALAQGNPSLAQSRFDRAHENIADIPSSPALQLRLATHRVVLALLFQKQSDPAAVEAFDAARRAVEALSDTEIASDEIDYLSASLDLHESQQIAQDGNPERALTLIQSANQTLNRLHDQRPDHAIIRSEMARSYLASASLLDGMGKREEAQTSHQLAAKTLHKLLEESPDSPDLQVDLAGSYGRMASYAMITGDTDLAEQHSTAASKILTDVLAEHPDHMLARARLASQHALIAGLLRDRGEAAKALSRYDLGLSLIQDELSKPNANPGVLYHGALVIWQRAKMIGFRGDHHEEIDQLNRAIQLLESLLTTPYGKQRNEQIQRTLGYLYGDRGHASQSAKQINPAKQAFSRAIAIWDSLHQDRPSHAEYAEALDWNRQRLNALPKN